MSPDKDSPLVFIVEDEPDIARLIAASLAMRPPTPERTWAYRRAEVLAAGAQAAVDDQPAGLTPLRLENVAPGRKRVRVVLAGYEPVTLDVEAEAGKETIAHARLTSKMVEILKARLEKDKDNLQDHVDLSHHYLVMGEHAQAAAALWEGYKVIEEGRVKVYPGEDDKPEARFYHECWKTYTDQHYYPPEGSEVIREACMAIMRKAAARDPRGYASKLLKQMEAYTSKRGKN